MDFLCTNNVSFDFINSRVRFPTSSPLPVAAATPLNQAFAASGAAPVAATPFNQAFASSGAAPVAATPSVQALAANRLTDIGPATAAANRPDPLAAFNQAFASLAANRLAAIGPATAAANAAATRPDPLAANRPDPLDAIGSATAAANHPDPFSATPATAAVLPPTQPPPASVAALLNRYPTITSSMATLPHLFPLPLSYTAIAQAQQTCPSIPPLTTNPSLTITTIPLNNTLTLLGDTSTGTFRPLIPTVFQRQIFNHIHTLAHPGIRATRRLISPRFLWSSLAKDSNTWCRQCTPCRLQT
jgi:hypothetical protein